MSQLEYRKLDGTELASALAAQPMWQIDNGMLTRLFEFKEYKDGLVFATTVGWLADNLNHHPDILIGYSKVRVSTTTHDSGGLTSYDFELAKRIDRVA